MTRFSKTVDPEDVALVIAILPPRVQAELEGAHLFWAAQQLVLDPEPFGDLHLAIALLRYLYPCEAGKPRFDLGLRTDLKARMASGRFVSIAPSRAEAKSAQEVLAATHRSPIALLNSAPRMRHLQTPAQRVAHLERLAQLTGVPNPREPLVGVLPKLEPVEA